MRVAGVREFRNHAPELMKSSEIVFVTRHGKLSGVLVPLANPQELPAELRRDLLERVGAAISAHLKKRGVGEKEVLRDFADWRKTRHQGRGRR